MRASDRERASGAGARRGARARRKRGANVVLSPLSRVVALCALACVGVDARGERTRGLEGVMLLGGASTGRERDDGRETRGLDERARERIETRARESD